MRRHSMVKKLEFAGYGMVLALLTLVGISPAGAQPPANVESVCLQCHSQFPEKFSRPVTLWRGSIHADNGIACNHCHGGNPNDAANAMNPAQGFLGVPKETDIPGFCGRCHVGVYQDYLASQHGQALGKGGPTCVTCHGAHQIAKVSLALINEQLCSRCHSFERAGRIKAAMAVLDGRIASLDTRIAAFKQDGVAVDRLEKELFAARNRFHTLFHTVDVQLVERESGQIATGLNTLDKALHTIDASRRQRRHLGGWAVLGALVLAVTAYLLRKSYD